MSSRLDERPTARPASRAKLLPSAVIYGCIDIGSNTTRLLVAGGGPGALREIIAQRAFTRIGHSLGSEGRIPAAKLVETVDVVRAQARLARQLGADEIVAVATAAIREARNADELVTAIERDAGLALRVLTGTEEARLSFAGATRTLSQPVEGTIAVVDVGGGSTEIAVGSTRAGVDWSESLRVGSGVLTARFLHTDPPAPAELEAARRHVAELFDGLAPPAAESVVAVGGTATSLRRLAGGELTPARLERALRILSGLRVDEVAQRLELDPLRVRLLPAGILVLEATARCLGLTPRIARGGLREGVILELLDGARPAG